MQVGSMLYFIADNDAESPRMLCVSNLEASGSNAIVTTKTAPPNQREYPALVNFNNECIFYGGGYWLATVNFYRIASDIWSHAPNISIAR